MTEPNLFVIVKRLAQDSNLHIRKRRKNLSGTFMSRLTCFGQLGLIDGLQINFTDPKNGLIITKDQTSS